MRGLRVHAKTTSHFAPPIHHAWLRYSSSNWPCQSFVVVPCQTGASTPQIWERILVRTLTIAAFLCVSLFAVTVLGQHTLDIVESNGLSENRIDLVIMGDGYTSGEQQDFASDAQNAIDHLFGKRPSKQYREFFNIVTISTISNESGADHPATSEYVDTFYDCAYDCAGLGHLICCDYSTILSVAGTEYPAYDVALLLVNDQQYGGSGGPVAIASTSPLSSDIPFHESGHVFAGLGDEYDSAYPGYVCEDIYPNISFTADRNDLKWNYWVNEDTPLPTPESAAVNNQEPVGAYEGACYETVGLFRPVYECVMRSLNNDFCAVCTEQMVLSYYGFVEPVDTYSPAQDSHVGVYGDSIDFFVEAVEPTPNTLAYTWDLDGEIVSWSDSADLEFLFSCVDQGEHQLTVTVSDLTNMVMVDPGNLMTMSVSWTVTRTDDGPVENCDDQDAGGDACLDGGYCPGKSGCGCHAIQARRTLFSSLLPLIYL